MNGNRKRILTVLGTRPEAVKLCPLLRELEADGRFECVLCLTGQHRDMVHGVLEVFSLRAHYDLDVMEPGQSLSALTERILRGLDPVLEEVRPDLLLVQGDTTSAFAGALAAFYRQIPVGHVEAGLRSHDPFSPFPEEMNRALIGRMAGLHFAPTEENRQNLLAEGIRENIYVTGNTGLDAFRTTVRPGYRFRSEVLRSIGADHRPLVLLTAHRRENWGRPLENICRAARRIAEQCPEVLIVFPVHPNPRVQNTVRSLLHGQEGILLTEPLEVEDMHNLLARSRLVLTDSGGLQEEAPAFGVPVLVLRTETERPEALAAGGALLAGVEEEDIVRHAHRLLRDEEARRAMTLMKNPFGDGCASRRILQALIGWFGLE